MRTRLHIVIALVLPLMAGAQDQVRTFAGMSGEPGGIDGPADTSRFNDPAGIAVAPDGTVYVADSRNHVIRAIAPGGEVTTVAGQSGEFGATDGTGSFARFNHPTGITVTPAGLILVSDTGNHTLRQLSTNGVVTTLAGCAEAAEHRDGPATSARFRSPIGLAMAPNGDLYIADCGNQVIRRLDPTGNVSTFAGRPESWGALDGIGTNALFNGPLGLAFDSQTNLFVSDANNHVIRKVTPAGQVSLFAGRPGTDGTADGFEARFGKPAELAVDRRDNLYVADSLNHTIRRLQPDGFVSTVSGVVGTAGAADGLNGAARFFNPYGLALTAAGRLLVADAYNQTIRELTAPFQVAHLADGNRIVLTWDSISGQRYRVEHASALAAAWQPLGPEQTATGYSVTVTNALPTTGSTYLRVVRLP